MLRAASVADESSSLWERIIATARSTVDPQLVDAYLVPLRLLSINDSKVTLAASSRFIVSQVERSLGQFLLQAFSAELGIDPVTLDFTIDVSLSTSSSSPSPIVIKRVRTNEESKPLASDDLRASYPSTINPRYTFSSFVVGNSNQFCHAAALRVAEEPGKSYNPLFIYGGVGLGKTHLLHAIGNLVMERNSNARVLYMSSEIFTNELIQALRHAKMEEFKTRLRSIDLLLIDDIQFMCGKERTQEEFFHTFNALYNAKRQIVISSDKIPQDTPGLEERLRTRFAWGLTADLQAPDYETRVAILRKKAALDGFELPEEVAVFIAQKVSSNIRELEGAVTRVHAMSALMSSQLSVELAERALRPLLQPKSVNVSVSDIKKVVCEHFGVKAVDLISKRRTKNLSWPRHVAMYLCRKHTTSSYPEIGSEFGGRDHSSVIHAASVVSDKVQSNDEVRSLIETIEKDLRG